MGTVSDGDDVTACLRGKWKGCVILQKTDTRSWDCEMVHWSTLVLEPWGCVAAGKTGWESGRALQPGKTGWESGRALQPGKTGWESGRALAAREDRLGVRACLAAREDRLGVRACLGSQGRQAGSQGVPWQPGKTGWESGRALAAISVRRKHLSCVLSNGGVQQVQKLAYPVLRIQSFQKWCLKFSVCTGCRKFSFSNVCLSGSFNFISQKFSSVVMYVITRDSCLVLLTSRQPLRVTSRQAQTS